MFCAVWRGAEAITIAARTRSGKVADHSSTCMPPIDPPIAASRLCTPRWSSNSAWARTMSRMVMTGKCIA